jgi:hypothetical protein
VIVFESFRVSRKSSSGYSDCIDPEENSPLRTQSKSLVKKYSDFYELGVSAVKYCFGCGPATLGYFGVRKKKVCPVTYFVASESR